MSRNQLPKTQEGQITYIMTDQLEHIAIPWETPLCLSHFLAFAKEYYNKYPSTMIQQDVPLQGTSDRLQHCPIRPDKKPLKPTRVQPRRTVKRKYMESKVMEQKGKGIKSTAEKSEEPRQKPRICNGPQFIRERDVRWSELESHLRTLIYGAVHRNAATGACLSRTDVWTCRECASDLARYVKALREADEFNSRAGAPPVADTKPTGNVILDLTCKDQMHILEDDKVHWSGLGFIVDSCVIPMIWILKAND
ncbi:hypothetical protein BGZ63DRAFT_401734 [Mariannaea sp. PMI_226]|nr:hypothetical protein BGZ63DRAFT_401734 [Mariannaea sp. PMI_226]